MEVLRRIRHCQYGNCNNNSKNKSVTFHRFPIATVKPIYFEKWIQNCGLESFELEFKTSSSNKYVCSRHFLGGKGPTKLHPHPTELNGKVILLNGKRIVIDEATLHSQNGKNSTGTSSLCNESTGVVFPSIKEEVPLNVNCNHQYDTNQGNNESSLKREAPLEKEQTCKKIRTCIAIKSPCDEYEENILPFNNTLFDNTNNADSSFMPSNSESSNLDISRPSCYATNENNQSLVVKASTNKVVAFPGGNALSSNQLACGSSIIEPLISLSNLREAIGCPLNWMTYYSKDEASYSVVKNNSIVMSFYVKKDMSTTLTVLGQIISKHTILQEISSKIECIDDILRSLKQLEKFDVCIGNAKCDFKILGSKIGNGFFCNLSNALHSQNCDGFFKKTAKTSRCSKCRCYRKVLTKSKWRISQKITRKKFGTFTKKQLISTIHKGKRREKYYTKQTLHLRQKISKIIATEGHEITETD